MGILRFASFFTEQFTNPLNTHHVNEYRGCTVIVDTIQRLMKQCIGKLSNGEESYDANGKSNIHLVSLLSTATYLLNIGINPIFVFDGKAPKEKYYTINNRRMIREKAQEKCSVIVDKTSKEYIKNSKKSFHFTHEQLEDMKTLLTLMGIKYVVAIGEADQQCAALSAFYNAPVITDDTDILVFGGCTIWRDFSMRTGRVLSINRQSILSYCLMKSNEILEQHGLQKISVFTHSNFVDFCVMMGSDYKFSSKKIQIIGISNSRIFECFVINNFDIAKTTKYILENHNDVKISSNFCNGVLSIKNIYENAVVYDPKDINIQMLHPNIRDFVTFCTRHGIDKQFLLSKSNVLLNTLQNIEHFSQYDNINNTNNVDTFGNFMSYRHKYYKSKHNHSQRLICVH